VIVAIWCSLPCYSPGLVRHPHRLLLLLHPRCVSTLHPPCYEVFCLPSSLQPQPPKQGRARARFVHCAPNHLVHVAPVMTRMRRPTVLRIIISIIGVIILCHVLFQIAFRKRDCTRMVHDQPLQGQSPVGIGIDLTTFYGYYTSRSQFTIVSNSEY
jgi:hypothetical protein